MRLQLQLSPNTKPVPFNHLHQLTGALHKWLGENNIHDGLSLYSFGWLRGGEKVGNYLHYPHGAIWNVGFYDSQHAWSLAKGIIQDDQLGYGMKVKKALELPIPAFTASHTFLVDGMVVVRKKRSDDTREYLFWDNPQADDLLTGLLQKKLQKAGFSPEHQQVSVQFDRSYTKARIKLVDIKGTKHKGSSCPVIISGSPEAISFAWKVGIGELTGSGLGALL